MKYFTTALVVVVLVALLATAQTPLGTIASGLAGLAAAGAAPVGNPVYTAGIDTGGNVRPLQTDTSGKLFVYAQGMGGNGFGVSGSPVLMGGSDGTNARTLLQCRNSVAVAVTAGNTTELVALTSSQTIYVCAYSISMSTAGTAQWKYGTGTNCGTGTTNISGAMNLATATPDSQTMPGGYLFAGAASNALCLGAVTGNVNGWVTYAKF